jgi:hypothetical protein
VAIGGQSWDVLGRVWYETLTKWTKRNDDFQAFADATGDVAGSLFGLNGRVQRAVRKAWTQVGLPPTHHAAPRLAILGRRPAGCLSEAIGTATPKWRTRPNR